MDEPDSTTSNDKQQYWIRIWLDTTYFALTGFLTGFIATVFCLSLIDIWATDEINGWSAFVVGMVTSIVAALCVVRRLTDSRSHPLRRTPGLILRDTVVYTAIAAVPPTVVGWSQVIFLDDAAFPDGVFPYWIIRVTVIVSLNFGLVCGILSPELFPWRRHTVIIIAVVASAVLFAPFALYLLLMLCYALVHSLV